MLSLSAAKEVVIAGSAAESPCLRRCITQSATYFIGPADDSDLQSRQKQRAGGDDLKYMGVNEEASGFYVFSGPNQAPGGRLMCVGSDSDRMVKASGVVRYGNVVGIRGVDENQLNGKYLPKMDGVDAYAAMTGNGELTFRVCNGKVKLLSVGSKWVANHAGDSGALDLLLSRYDHPKEVTICNDKGSVSYNTETKQQVG
ncbi:hypothetical protein AAVH_37581 [Aphelenchoides avenae]|nr:hypothetical protein AAVH_37581 [Aphelenchus avenae]